MNPKTSPNPPRRSVLVTVLGWLVAISSAAASMLSVLAGMMYLVGSDGTRSGMTLENILFLAGPPVTLVAGICLIRRRRWAWLYMILLLAAFSIHSLDQLARSPIPQSTRISADGVPTTTLASDGNGSVPMTMLSLGLLALLLSRKVRSEFWMPNTHLDPSPPCSS